MDDLGLTDPKFIAIVVVVLAALFWYWKRSRRTAGNVSYKYALCDVLFEQLPILLK